MQTAPFTRFCRRRLCFQSVTLALLFAPLFLFPQSDPQSPQDSPDTQEAPVPVPIPAAPTGETATVHGIVINAASGEPLPRALVHMTSGKILGALTDGDGRFSIDGVPTGLQTFDVEKPGFGGVLYMSDYSLPASHAVHVATEMPDLRFLLSPQNAIYGQITLSTGDPAVAIGIGLLKQTVQGGHAEWNEIDHRQTNPEGQFRFAGLGDGTYLLMARPSFENDAPDASTCDPKSPDAVTGYPTTFYGGSGDLAGAARIVVSGGQSTRTNFTLAQTEFRQVQISYPKPHGSVPWQIVGSLADSEGLALAYPLHRDENAHAFCAYLPSGAYIFSVDASFGCGPGSTMQCFVRSAEQNRDLQGLLAFNVEGSPQRKLQVPLAEGASTPIHTRFEPGPPPKLPRRFENGVEEDDKFAPLTIAAVPVSDSGALGENLAEARSTGADTYQLPSLKPGRYWIGASMNLPGSCLGPVTAGGPNLAHTPWTAGASGTGQPIDVVVHTDCAKLSLQLPPATATGLPGEDPTFFFYVVPSFDYSGELHEGGLQTTGDRQVDLTDMTPGTYHIYVFRSPHALEFHNPDAMDRLAGKGQEVTLEPGGSTTLIVEVPAS